MKIYLAARYSRFHELQRYAEELQQLGYCITSRWIRGDHNLHAGGMAEADVWQRQWAEEDWNDLIRSDIVISFTEPPGEVPGRARGGRHVEFGAALALGKSCWVVGYRENTFHWLPCVEYFPTWELALVAITPGRHGEQRREVSRIERDDLPHSAVLP